MLLLTVLTGLLLVLPGLESYVQRVPDDSVFDADLLDDTILDRLIRRYREQLQNVKRLNKGLNEEDVEVEEEKYEYPASKHDTNYQDDNTLKDTQFDVKELPPADVNTETEASNNKKQETKNDTDQPDSNSPHPPQPHVQQQQQHHHQHKVTGMNKDGVVFILIVAACSVAGLVGLIMAGVCWYKLHTHVKAASDVDYPAYGVTGPTKERSPSQGDRKLAQSAQMYHYQHQKQQMIAMEKANGEMKPDASEDESEEENEEGDYTVYECPGLAPTGEMEVRNPLFTEDAQTPVNGQAPVVNGHPDDRKD